MSLYKKIAQNILLPLGDLFSRQRVMHYYRFYSDSQWWEYERLKNIQNSNLRTTIQTAYREVPFYNELYSKQKVDIDRVTGVNDLSKLPFVTKNMLRQAYPDKCTRQTAWPWHEFCTSGSSGQPFAVRVDNLSMSHARALMLLRANFSGWQIGDPMLQTGMTLERGFVKFAKDKMLRTAYVSAFDLSDPVLDRYLEMIDDGDIHYIMGYPGSVYFLACRAREVCYKKNLLGIVTWGDNLYEHYRRSIETQFGCTVTDTYGCGEGIQIAAQCTSGNYHIFMPHVAVEVVDDKGIPVSDGEPGNILLTRLDPGAMPLIRYQVGDIGRKLPNIKCSCGRGLEMLSSIEGRDTDAVITPNGNRLIVHFFTGIFEYYQSIDTFKVEQTDRDAITIKIVPRSDFREEEMEKIKMEIWSKGDRDLKVHIELVDFIPLEASKKRKFVVSHLNNN